MNLEQVEEWVCGASCSLERLARERPKETIPLANVKILTKLLSCLRPCWTFWVAGQGGIAGRIMAWSRWGMRKSLYLLLNAAVTLKVKVYSKEIIESHGPNVF